MDHHGENRLESFEGDGAKQLSPDGTDSPDSPLRIKLKAIAEDLRWLADQLDGGRS